MISLEIEGLFGERRVYLFFFKFIGKEEIINKYQGRSLSSISSTKGIFFSIFMDLRSG